MSTLILDTEIDALRGGTFELHCLWMRLESLATPPVEFYEGAGSIRQEGTGQLALTMYWQQAEGGGPWFRNYPARQLFPEEAYFRLSAIDQHGREWTASHVFPGFFVLRQEGRVIRAPIRELRCTRDHVAERELDPANLDRISRTLSLRSYIFRDLRFPANERTKQTIQVGPATYERDEWNAAHFAASGFDFLLRSTPRGIEVHANCEGMHLPPQFRLRVADALQFVLAQPVTPSVSVEIEAGQERVYVRGAPPDRRRAQLDPPIATNRIDAKTETWRLFGRYLDHISARPEEDPSPIVGHWRGVMRASEGAIETLAVVMCVAVEGILRGMDVPRDPALEPRRRTLQYWVRKLRRRLPDLGVAASVRDDVYNALSSALRRSAVDRLHALAERQVTARTRVEAWHHLRNRVLHGDLFSSYDVQGLLNATDEVLVLLYDMIYYVIGYDSRASARVSPPGS